MLKRRHVGGWLVLGAILFAATATLAVLAVQTPIVTLNTHLTTTPPSGTIGGYNWTSRPPLPQIFFGYIYLLTGLVVADVMTVQRLRRGVLRKGVEGLPAPPSTPSTGPQAV